MGMTRERRRALTRKNLWESLPRAARAAFGHALGLVPQRWLFGQTFREEMRLLAEAEWWPRERARQHQVEQLRRVLALARTAPLYERSLREAGLEPEDIRRPEDIRALPTIGRATLQSFADEMRTTSPAAADLVTTGGTSGEPVRLWLDADRSGREMAHLLQSWIRVGYRGDTPLAVLRGRVVRRRRNGLCHEHDPALRQHHYSSFHLGDDDARRYLDHIGTIGTCHLHAYPSSAAALARFIRRTGVAPPRNIVGIIAESETVYPEQRALVEDTFGCRVLAGYGHTEKAVCAWECELTRGVYHTWPTYGFVEVVDDDGRPVPRGGRGEVVATGFLSTVMPLVRYRTGDFATWLGEGCEACGRQQALLADIEGHRTQESLVARDGALIGIAAINMHDDTFDNVRRYQFRQDEPGRAVLRVVPAGAFDEADGRRIVRSLARKLGERVALTIEVADDIPLTPRGKTTYVDQRIAGVAAPDAPASDRADAGATPRPTPPRPGSGGQRRRRPDARPASASHRKTPAPEHPRGSASDRGSACEEGKA